jgi:hypothetical protein
MAAGPWTPPRTAAIIEIRPGNPQHQSKAGSMQTRPVLLGAGTGALAAIAVALANPGLYIDWGVFPGALVVIPLASMGVTAW